VCAYYLCILFSLFNSLTPQHHSYTESQPKYRLSKLTGLHHHHLAHIRTYTCTRISMRLRTLVENLFYQNGCVIHMNDIAVFERSEVVAPYIYPFNTNRITVTLNTSYIIVYRLSSLFSNVIIHNRLIMIVDKLLYQNSM
jgi:hypothetical protein